MTLQRLTPEASTLRGQGVDTPRSIKINLEAGSASIAELGKVLGITGVNIRDVKRDYDAAPPTEATSFRLS